MVNIKWQRVCVRTLGSSYPSPSPQLPTSGQLPQAQGARLQVQDLASRGRPHPLNPQPAFPLSQVFGAGLIEADEEGMRGGELQGSPGSRVSPVHPTPLLRRRQKREEPFPLVSRRLRYKNRADWKSGHFLQPSNLCSFLCRAGPKGQYDTEQ